MFKSGLHKVNRRFVHKFVFLLSLLFSDMRKETGFGKLSCCFFRGVEHLVLEF